MSPTPADPLIEAAGPKRSQAELVDALIRAATQARRAATNSVLFSTRSGMALVNSAFDLFECDQLYDLAGDIANDIGEDRDGNRLGAFGEIIAAGDAA